VLCVRRVPCQEQKEDRGARRIYAIASEMNWTLLNQSIEQIPNFSEYLSLLRVYDFVGT
jgi:hypothetical protein